MSTAETTVGPIRFLQRVAFHVPEITKTTSYNRWWSEKRPWSRRSEFLKRANHFCLSVEKESKFCKDLKGHLCFSW